MSLFDSLLPVVGTAVGGYLGGSGGAQAGGSLGAGLGGLLVSNQNAAAQTSSINAALAAQQAEFNQTQQNLAPYRAAGATATGSLMNLLGLGSGYSSALSSQLAQNAPATAASTGASAASAPSMPWYQSFINAIDPGNISGHSSSSSILGNVLDPGNLGSQFGLNVNPSAGGPNKATALGGDAFAAYFGGGALLGAAQNAHAAQTQNGMRYGGNPSGGQHGRDIVVGEEGPEILHMNPGSTGHVTPNPGTMSRMMLQHRATGGPVTGGALGNVGTPNFNPTAGNNVALSGNGQTPASILAQQPQYQFTMQQGIQGLDNSALASGGMLTGQHMSDILNYSQGLASNTFQSIVNNLSNVAGLGSAATSEGGQLGAYNNMSAANLYQASGNAQAAGNTGGLNSILGGLGGMFGAAGQNPNLFGSMFGGNSAPQASFGGSYAQPVTPVDTGISNQTLPYIGSGG